MSDEFNPYAIYRGSSDAAPRAGDRLGDKIESEAIAVNELRSIIERMENFAEDKAVITDGEKSVMAEAKAKGYDTKAIRSIIRMRKQDPAKLANEQSVLDTYMAALGMDGGA